MVEESALILNLSSMCLCKLNLKIPTTVTVLLKKR